MKGFIEDYLKHVSRHLPLTETLRLRQFDCPICSFSHYNVSSLRKHFRKSHESVLSTTKSTSEGTTTPEVIYAEEIYVNEAFETEQQVMAETDIENYLNSRNYSRNADKGKS